MQNGKWQGTEHKVHMLKCWVSLSWPGNLCRIILISWEPRNLGQDLKSALHRDKPGRKHSIAHSRCPSPSKPYSSKTQTGIMKSLCCSLEAFLMWGMSKCPCPETEVWLGPALQLDLCEAHLLENLTTTWTKARAVGTPGRFTSSSWSELKHCCKRTLKDNPPR